MRLELDRLKALAKTDEEGRWLESAAVLGVPTAKMKPLAGLLEAVGHGGLALRTVNVLLLHGYQYHGPDPGGELSKYAAREDAAADIAAVAQEAARRVEPLRGRIKRGGGLEHALEEARSLGPLNMLLLSPSSPLRNDARRGGRSRRSRGGAFPLRPAATAGGRGPQHWGNGLSSLHKSGWK